ncbi:MAG TPA: ABC transporter substrate-binding protein [Firmicutes bacterium]|nr:ABC transporter substrate-binding protein [Bacillota bacterium]
MKKLCLLMVVGVLGFLGGCKQETENLEANSLEHILAEGKITMATSPDYAPYEFIDATKTGDDKYVGADIELGKYIAKKLGVELEIKAMDFSAVLVAVGEGKVDMAISGIGYKPERAEAMEFSKTYSSDDSGSETDLCTGHGLLVLKETADQYTSLADFSSKTVAAQSASLQEGFVQNQLPDAKLQTIASLSDGVLRVQSKKVDALAISCSTGTQYVKANDDLTMLPFVFEVDETEGTMVGIPKGETELVDAINEIIDEVIENGLYQQWVEEYTTYAESLGIN